MPNIRVEKKWMCTYVYPNENMLLCNSTGGGNGVASVPSSLYIFIRCKEGILAAILIDFLYEIELILQGEVIHLIQITKNISNPNSVLPTCSSPGHPPARSLSVPSRQAWLLICPLSRPSPLTSFATCSPDHPSMEDKIFSSEYACSFNFLAKRYKQNCT